VPACAPIPAAGGEEPDRRLELLDENGSARPAGGKRPGETNRAGPRLSPNKERLLPEAEIAFADGGRKNRGRVRRGDRIEDLAGRLERREEDFDAPRAAEPGSPHDVVAPAKVVLRNLRPPAREDAGAPTGEIGFETASADRPRGRSVLGEDHPRARAPVMGALHGDEMSEHAAAVPRGEPRPKARERGDLGGRDPRHHDVCDLMRHSFLSGRALAPPSRRSAGSIGSSRTRTPVASKTALATAA